jgi:ATP-dependent DNA helicase RecQ
LAGVEPDLAGVLLGGLEEAGLISRGYDLWGEVEVRRVDEEPEDLREEVARVHAVLPGGGVISLPELARRADVRPVVAQTALFKLMVDGLVEVVSGGSLADIRLKKESLDRASRRSIAARLKSRTSAAYDQIRAVETYATLETCRREHLLRHFGDTQEVAPCGGCDICLGEADGLATLSKRAPTTAQSSIPVADRALIPEEPNGAADTPSAALDIQLFERLRAWRGDQARRQQVPAYVVLHNSHLEEIAHRKPRSIHELGSIKGIGLRRAARYGDEILALVHGEETVSQGGPDSPAPDYRQHLEAAERLLRSGQGAAAVTELARAIEMGGEEAKRDVNNLLTTTPLDERKES